MVARIARGGNARLLQGFLQGVGRLPQIVRAVRRGEDEDGVGISAVRQGNVNEAVRAGGDVSERVAAPEIEAAAEGGSEDEDNENAHGGSW